MKSNLTSQKVHFEGGINLSLNMRSTNSKPHPSNQYPIDKIKSHTTFFPVQEVDFTHKDTLYRPRDMPLPQYNYKGKTCTL